jgi:hypothetical protein
MESGRTERVEGVKRLSEILKDLQPPQNIESQDALIMAKALAYTNRKQSALQMVNQVMQNPDVDKEVLTRAVQLKTEIENNQYAPPANDTIQVQPQINPSLLPEIINQQRLKIKIPQHLQINNDL